MHKKSFKTLVFILMYYYAQMAFCQTTDLTHVIHERVEHFPLVNPDIKDLQELQKAFGSHTKKELASALIADLDVDRKVPWKNHSRNFAVGRLYKALGLPPVIVCQELEKEQSPQRKVRLMAVLWGLKTPEVTTALVHQLKDRRSAEEYIGDPEEPVEALRVCDVASNTLNHNFDPNGYARRISFSSSDDRRDEIIKATLKELKLDGQQ